MTARAAAMATRAMSGLPRLWGRRASLAVAARAEEGGDLEVGNSRSRSSGGSEAVAGGGVPAEVEVAGAPGATRVMIVTSGRQRKGSSADEVEAESSDVEAPASAGTDGASDDGASTGFECPICSEPLRPPTTPASADAEDGGVAPSTGRSIDSEYGPGGRVVVDDEQARQAYSAGGDTGDIAAKDAYMWPCCGKHSCTQCAEQVRRSVYRTTMSTSSLTHARTIIIVVIADEKSYVWLRLRTCLGVQQWCADHIGYDRTCPFCRSVVTAETHPELTQAADEVAGEAAVEAQRQRRLARSRRQRHAERLTRMSAPQRLLYRCMEVRSAFLLVILVLIVLGVSIGLWTASSARAR